MTCTRGPIVKLAVSALAAADDTLDARPTASDDPRESTSRTLGRWPRRPALVSWLHITPDDVMARTLERSHRPGWASRAASIGLAKASPTMTTMFTRRSCTVCQSTSAENAPGAIVTIDPPDIIVMNELN